MTQRVYPLPDQFQNARQLIQKGYTDVICLEALIYARWGMTLAVIVLRWCERTNAVKILASSTELQCKICLLPTILEAICLLHADLFCLVNSRACTPTAKRYFFP